jgi:hypothetical protein
MRPAHLPILSAEHDHNRGRDYTPVSSRALPTGWNDTFQMSVAYSRIARSDENHDMWAMLRMLVSVQRPRDK